MNDFELLRNANLARDKEWQTQPISWAFRGNELAGEVGEACNIIKKLERERMKMVGSRASVEDLAKELADIIICVDLIAMHFDIDLAEHVKDKFNYTSKKYGLTTRLK
jgi:NTP pyrophosphatase (non-canonical NTP hydrolase)